ncbi:MAG TPA: hypothetical protein VJI12_00445 [archaeon]|nr:hypothetical protein [archaeon]
MKYIDKYSVAAFFMWLASFVVYVNYYDILIPGIQDGSYRVAVGQFFAVPSFILSAGQVLIGGFLIFACVYLFTHKSHKTKSLFTAAFMVMLFSLTYVVFPMYGPFYFIVFATSIAPPGVLLFEIAWISVLLAASTALMHRLQKVPLRYAFFTAAVTGIFIVVAAS